MFLSAALSASAYGAPASTVKTHGRSLPAGRAANAQPAAHHRAASSTTSRKTGPAAAPQAHRATPEEVGRAAGLKIRRNLDRQRQASPHAHRTSEPARAARKSASARTTVAAARSRRPDRTTSAVAETSKSLLRHPARLPSRPPETAEENPPQPLSDRDSGLGAQPQPVSLHIVRGGMPSPLRGSFASLQRQNKRLEDEGLERIQDENDLSARIAQKLLVPLPASAALTVNGNLPAHHRYCRPWTAQFLADLARAHTAAFHRPLQVSSAVRTAAYQEQLRKINGNAAAAEGDIVSPHLMGATIDIAKDNLSRSELAWMRRRLLALQSAGKIDVEEEFQQACFHITVYKNYAPSRAPRRSAQAHAPAGEPRAPAAPPAAPDAGETGGQG